MLKLLSIFILVIPLSAGAADDMQKWQASMNTLSATLVDAFPFLYSSTEFRDKKNEKAILKHLEKLASTTHMLPTKSGEVLIGAEPLIESSQVDMKDQLRSAIALYKVGKHEESQKLIHQSVQRCFACHTAYQVGPRFPTTNKEVMAMATPFTMGKAIVFGSLRQFDGALELIEKNPATDELTKLYLVVSLRATQNFARTLTFLERLGKSNANAERWIADVKAWQGFAQKNESSENIKSYIDKQRAISGSKADSLFVVNLMESYILHKRISTQNVSAQEKKNTFAQLASIYQNLGFTPLSGLAEIYSRKAR